ncbi:MAG: hypothetical protein Q4P36_06745 [Bowdeniella nasicola]|nr:hypothetical protein [Bowdeniella nasicola]
MGADFWIPLACLGLAAYSGYQWWKALYTDDFRSEYWILNWHVHPMRNATFLGLSTLGGLLAFGGFGLFGLASYATGQSMTELLHATHPLLGLPPIVGLLFGFIGWLWPWRLPPFLDPETRSERRAEASIAARRAAEERGELVSAPEPKPPAEPVVFAKPSPSIVGGRRQHLSSIPYAGSVAYAWFPIVVALYLLRVYLGTRGRSPSDLVVIGASPTPAELAPLVAIGVVSVGFALFYANDLRTLPKAHELVDPRAEVYANLEASARSAYDQLPDDVSAYEEDPSLLEPLGITPAQFAVLTLSDADALRFNDLQLEGRRKARRTAIGICTAGIAIFTIMPTLGVELPALIWGVLASAF